MPAHSTVRILGLDPGLRNTGYGVLESAGAKLSFIGAGVVHSTETLSLSERLAELHLGIKEVFDEFQPDECAVEETFVNKNPTSTLKLGQARGAVLLVPALKNVPVFEYTPNQIKKSVVGAGHAEKAQVDMMVHVLLPKTPQVLRADATDALAAAICHAHLRGALKL